MGAFLRLEMDNCNVSVRVTWKEETVSPKGIVGRKGMVNSQMLTVDDGHLFEIGKIAEAVLAISYISNCRNIFQ